MSSEACLALLLDGPMQSWGFASRFTRRTTALHPTKSAIVGMLAAAAGIDKHAAGEASQLEPLTALRCTAIALPRMGRTEPRPMLRLSDYHTVGGGYEDADWMKRPRSADGKTLKNAILTDRHYLLDARFGILLEGPRPLLDGLAGCLRNPKWGVWLGRKCCLPASPILVELADDRVAALRALLGRTGYPTDRALESFDHVIEGPEAEGLDAEWLQDTPVAFGAPIGGRHAPRRVRHVRRC